MAFEDKKGIVVASPFKLQAEALLDVRQQVDTIAERDRLVTLKAATAGLRVFVKENSTSYVYNGSSWDPLTTGAPYKHPTGDGNHHVPATGTTNSGKFLKSGATAGSEAWSKITASDITGLPTKLPNPKAIIFTGAATGSYDGSSELTVNIPTSGTTDSALTIQMNGGTAEGTNKFTFNGSAAKNVNITPALIGAATSNHTHTPASIGAATAVHNHEDADIIWADKSLSGRLSPLDSALSNVHSANRFAFADPAGITVEYSRNNGDTWQAYDTNDTAKINLVSGLGASYSIGAESTGITNQYKLRITLDAVKMKVYTALKKLLINISTNGAAGCKCQVEKAQRGSETNFDTVGTYNIDGWSGWNSIPIKNAFGGSESQTSNLGAIRLTFYITSTTSSPSNLIVSDIYAIGDTYWATPSVMAKTGHMYEYDSNKNVTFPANVTAKTFIGNLSGTATALSTNAGAANKPVYFKEGKPVECTHTLDKSVPSNAVFTDTVYTHPDSHPATMITQDNTHRFVTDEEKTAWNGKAPASHTHPATQITGLPTKLPNPQPLKFTGAATATYDGSGAVTVDIPTAQASPFALTVQLNGGTSEGTNKFTFNGGSAKTINITPASIGAALSVHNHNAFKGASASAAGGTGFVPAPAIGEQEKYLRGDGTWQPISLTLAALGITASATELNYMKGVTSSVQTQLNGKASSSHTHNLGNGTTPGFTKLYKWEDNPSTEDFTGAITSQFLGQYTTNKILPRITDNLNSIEKIKDGTTSVGKAEHVVDTVKKQNIGLTYDDIPKAGPFDKCKFAVYYDNSIISGMAPDRIPGLIGAALESHTHNYAGSSSEGGSANSAIKLATARQLNGVAFDGTKNIDIPIKYTQLQASAFKNQADRLNTVVDPGYYHIDGSMESYDFPVTSDNTALQVIPIGNGTNKLQVFYNSGVFSYRDTVNDTWKHLYSQDAPPNADAVGASPVGHRHRYDDITDIAHAHVQSSAAIRDSSNQNEITLSYSEAAATSFSYIPVFTGAGHIGNIGKSSFLTQVGAAPKSHTHNYAGSSSEGGPANSAKKVDFPVGTVLWTTSSSASFFSSTCGGTWEVMGNIDAIVNTSTTITLYMHKKTAL